MPNYSYSNSYCLKTIGGHNKSKKLYYLYDANGICGFSYSDGTTANRYIYQKNLQGDITDIINIDNGNIVASYTYDAWGNILTKTGTLADVNPLRYRGYYYDNETGLYYLNSRYYDSTVGRFINADSINYIEPETLNGINLYAYCLNNPVMFTDSNGTNIFEDAWNWVKQAGTDAWNWVKQAGTDAWNWTKQAGIDVGDFFKNTVWNDWIVGGVWNTFCVDWVANTFAKEWVWETFCVKWVAQTFARDWIWNGILKPASQNPIVNGILQVGGLIIAIAGAIVTAPVWATILTVAGIVAAAIGTVLWFRTLFD